MARPRILGAASEPDDRLCATLLPDPDSPTTPRVWPCVDGEGHSTNRVHCAVLGRERHAQRVDLQESRDAPSGVRLPATDAAAAGGAGLQLPESHTLVTSQFWLKKLKMQFCTREEW